MAFHNVPPNGFPDIPDIEDLEAVQGDIKTLQTTTGELGTAITGLTTSKAPKTDIATTFSAESDYAVGDLVYYEGVLYKCTTAHEAAAWNAEDFTAASVGSVASSLMSGLTNVDNATILNTQDLTTPSRTKNLLPMTLNGIKSANTTGTWAGNVYTIGYDTYTVSADDNGVVTSIEGTSTSADSSPIRLDFDLKAGSYILSSGFAELFGYNDTFLQKNGVTIARGNNSSPGQNFTLSEDSELTWFFRTTNITKTAYPMIRLANVSDATFAPYVPSVESRLEAVESGLTNIAGLKFLPVNFTDTFEAGATLTNGVTISDLTGGILTNDSRIKGIVLYNVYPFYMFQLQYQGKIMLGTDVARTSQETITNRMVIMYI